MRVIRAVVVWVLALGVCAAAHAAPPVASGPGLGGPAVLFEAPATPGFWFVGGVTYGSRGAIEIDFDWPGGAAGGTYSVVLTLTNNAGMDFHGGLDIVLTGDAVFADGPSPVRLMPMDTPPTVFEDGHLRFDSISWDDGGGNILEANLTATGDGPVRLRLVPVPEPGTAGLLVLGSMLLLRRRGR